MKTKSQEKDNSDQLKNQKQTNEEIAEQGFTVRDGHNPNKPNPNEKKNSSEIKNSLNVVDGFENNRKLEDDYDEDELDNEGNLKFENDELDNPSNQN